MVCLQLGLNLVLILHIACTLNVMVITYFSQVVLIIFFLQNNILYQDVLDAQVIHLEDNLSNHEPIFISLKIDSLPVHISENNVETNKT